ncbi:MAG: DNA polymerase III subunit delta' [Endomicrobium sp.]|jgi:DNA polymerase-3 subunit delta'|nr:DNA polymerase III subunit delta' [Endomicrobium sp.]
MFDNILGQQKVKKILSSQIKNDRVAHAYIFIGSTGIGKRLMALEFAKILNCNMSDFNISDIGACGVCRSCKKITKNIHPDLHFVDFAKQADMKGEELAKQKTLKIEIMKYMQKKIATKAYEGKWKIFIIEPAEKMNITAANSLLKTIEELPENTIIILIAKHKEAIPRTIVSRSQILFFQPLSNEMIITWLMSNFSLSLQKAQEIAKISEGSLEFAIQFINEKKNEGISLWNKLNNKKLYISDILNFSKNIMQKNNALECINTMITEVKKDFRVYPKKFAVVLNLLNNSRTLLLKNVNSQIVLDNLFLDLLDFKGTFIL